MNEHVEDGEKGKDDGEGERTEGSDVTGTHVLFENAVRSVGKWALIFLIIFPTAVALVVFALIPVSPAQDERGDASNFLRQTATFAIIKNPLVYIFFSHFHLEIFSTCFNVRIEMWSPYKLIHVAVAVAVAVVDVIVLQGSKHVPRLFGLYGIVAFYIFFVLGLVVVHHYKKRRAVHPLEQRQQQQQQQQQQQRQPSFGKAIAIMCQIIAVILTYYALCCAYVILFRRMTSSIQNAMVFVFSIVTFLFKLALLGICDALPIDFQMLISGFWLQNLQNIMQTLTFPTYKNPKTFILSYFITFATSLSYLIFLTKTWFTVRAWLRALGCILLCRCTPQYLDCTPIEEDIPDDRGHSNVRPGFLKRQHRFIYLRLFSEFLAGIFWLVVSPALRYSVNRREFPYSTDPKGGEPIAENAFAYSLYYAAGMAVLAVLTLWFCNAFIKKYFPQIYQQTWKRETEESLLENPRYYSFTTSIICTNLFLSILIVQYDSKIYYFNSD